MRQFYEIYINYLLLGGQLLTFPVCDFACSFKNEIVLMRTHFWEIFKPSNCFILPK